MENKLQIKSLLRDSWKAVRRKYFINVLIVFIVGVIVGGYTFSTNNAVIGNTQEPSAGTISANVMVGRITGKSNAQIIEEMAQGFDLIHITADPQSTAQKYTHGVISVFANQASSSGSFGFGILNGINILLFKGSVGRSIVVFSLAIVLLLFNIFVRNIFIVGRARYFLEHRRFNDTRADRLLFVYRYGCTFNVARIMLLRYVYQLLWNFTIVGGVIKAYEYGMIPYILAENPTISARECFKLSKELSMNNKKRMFGLDLVYGVAYIISSFTYNFLAVFFLNPMRQCTTAEIYMTLRGYKLAGMGSSSRYSIYLNDRLLGISNMSEGVYPESAYALKPLDTRSWIKIDYDRKYTFSTIVLFFFTFSFVGWAWEVFYTLLNEGVLANRGTMTGPWLPIYGVGGMIIIVFLKPLRKNPLVMFGGSFVACGVLEYFASWILEQLFDAKWWDYTGYFLNINGRVCLEGLFVFGLAGVAFTYLFAPLLDNLYSKLKKEWRKPVCAVLLIAFAIDLAWSAFHPNMGAGVTYDEGGMGAGNETLITEEEV
ncbi:MAG: hypothetical protein MJ108_01235 [Saccharofermentans sp.]|nr:hypothetical protein [Saccharofermentans sp.]